MTSIPHVHSLYGFRYGVREVTDGRLIPLGRTEDGLPVSAIARDGMQVYETQSGRVYELTFVEGGIRRCNGFRWRQVAHGHTASAVTFRR